MNKDELKRVQEFKASEIPWLEEAFKTIAAENGRQPIKNTDPFTESELIHIEEALTLKRQTDRFAPACINSDLHKKYSIEENVALKNKLRAINYLMTSAKINKED